MQASLDGAKRAGKSTTAYDETEPNHQRYTMTLSRTPYCLTNPKFDALLQEIGALHDDKNAGYAGSVDDDPLANFRLSERLGVPMYIGIVIRMCDKFMRILSLIRKPANDRVNESLRDSLRDNMVYSGLALIALDEHDEMA